MLTGLACVLLSMGAPSVVAPAVDLQLPNPAVGLVGLERTLNWVALLEPSLAPARIRAAGSELELDLLSPPTLEALGLSTSQPMRVLLDPGSRTLTAEFKVKDRKKVLAHLAQLASKAKDRPAVARWGDAVLIDTGTPYLAAVVLEKDRFFIQLPEAPRLSFFEDPSARMRLPAAKKTPKRWTDHARLAPLAAHKKRKKFSAPKLETDKTPDLYFRTSGGSSAPATTGALVTSASGFSLHTLAALDGRQQVAMGEVLSSKLKARSLFDEAPLRPAFSLRGKLVGSGARLLVERLGLPAALTAGVGGLMHAVVTANGELVLELEAGEKVGEPARVLLEKVCKERVRSAKVVLDSEARRLGFYVGAANPAGLRKLGEEESASIVLDLWPEHILSVLGSVRDRYGPGLQLNNVELMAARLLLEPLVRSTGRVHVEVHPRGAALLVRADIQYRE